MDDPWINRSLAMRCETCMWFVLKQAQIENDEILSSEQLVGRCRRHAPTMNGYPVVVLGDWCGDHKLDENKV